MTSLRRALLDGALIILPIGAIVLLVLGILHRLEDAAHPLAGSVAHPLPVAVAALLVLCVATGLLVRSAMGRWARDALEARLFEKLPGYRLVKAFTSEAPIGAAGGRAPRPALVAFDDSACPGLLMDVLPDGRHIVFVPGSPAPMSGAVHLVAAERVTLLDVPLPAFLKAVSSWGLGLGELVVQSAERQRADLARGVTPPG